MQRSSATYSDFGLGVLGAGALTCWGPQARG